MNIGPPDFEVVTALRMSVARVLPWYYPRAPDKQRFGGGLMLIQLVSRSKKARKVNHLTEPDLEQSGF